MSNKQQFENKYLGEFLYFGRFTDGQKYVATQINTNEVYMRGKGTSDDWFVSLEGFDYRVLKGILKRVYRTYE